MLEDLERKQIVNKQYIMLFDLATGGHHATYIQYVVRYWLEQRLTGQLDIIVSPLFLDKHADVVQLVGSNIQSKVRILSVTEAEYNKVTSKPYPILRFLSEWFLSFSYAKKLKVHHCLFMYLDYLQLPIALQLKFPCSFSGIYFRPTLHYKDFPNYIPSWQERARQWRKKTLLYLLLKNSQFKVLFCLDPFAVPQIDKLNDKTKIIYLADPVEVRNATRSEVETLKNELTIDSQRKVLLLFGRLGYRKGMHQLMAAIKLLPFDVCQRICLLFVGSIPDLEKKSLENYIQEISCASPIQIIVRNEFIQDDKVHTYFQMADVVLAPYQRHVGMSGILLLAAAAQKPVLSSDYGLMGQLVRKYKLGMTLDTTSPPAIAQAITKMVSEGYRDLYDVAGMQGFVAQHSWEEFAGTLTRNLCPSST